jgi:hypothetical protein
MLSTASVLAFCACMNNMIRTAVYGSTARQAAG